MLLSTRRWEAERKVRAILKEREEERLDRIFNEWREVNRDAANATELLALFRHHPDLGEEFRDLAERAAQR